MEDDEQHYGKLRLDDAATRYRGFSIVVTSMLPEMAPHTYSINSDMLGTSTPENRYSNPWFLKHFDTETQTSFLQQVVNWVAHPGM